MKTSNALDALAFAYGYGLGGLEPCPDDKVPMEEVSSWLAGLIRKEREDAWGDGFDRGFYRGQVLPGDRDACEAGIENPYGPNGGE